MLIISLPSAACVAAPKVRFNLIILENALNAYSHRDVCRLPVLDDNMVEYCSLPLGARRIFSFLSFCRDDVPASISFINDILSSLVPFSACYCGNVSSHRQPKCQHHFDSVCAPVAHCLPEVALLGSGRPDVAPNSHTICDFSSMWLMGRTWHEIREIL